jgi:hypothetical protein
LASHRIEGSIQFIEHLQLNESLGNNEIRSGGVPSLAESVAQRWRDSGSEIRHGVDAEAVLAFELQNDIAIPEELAAFYRVANGVESDQNLFSVWELATVRRVPAALGDFRGIPDYGRIATTLAHADEYFAFADFMIMSHVFAVRVAPASRSLGEVVWICASEYGIAAASFSEFWEGYLADPWEAVLI